jgi:hypothetical protein
MTFQRVTINDIPVMFISEHGVPRPARFRPA